MGRRRRRQRKQRMEALDLGDTGRWDLLREELSREVAWLARPLGALRGPYWREGIRTAQISDDGRLYVDPCVLAWSPEEVKAVLEHEVWHPVLMDGARGLACGISTPHEVTTWGLAVDAANNSQCLRAESLKALARAIGRQWPGHIPVTPSVLELDDGYTAEVYYQRMMERGGEDNPGGDQGGSSPSPGEDDPGGDQGACSGSGADGHPRDYEEPRDGDPEAEGGSPIACSGSGADGHPRDYEEPRDGDPEDENGGELAGWTDSERQSIRQEVAEAIRQEASRSRGSMPGGLLRWAEETLAPPVVDWRGALRRAVHQGVATQGRSDYSYRRLSRRDPAGSRGYLAPGLYTPRPRVAAVIDTSGSMGAGDLSRAVSETIGIVRAVGGECLVASCDAQATQFRRVTGVADLDLQGGGGTDMRVGIAAAARLRPRPQAIVVLTDGWTPWPNEPPLGTAVVAVIIGDGDGPEEVPPWITRVVIPPQDVSK